MIRTYLDWLLFRERPRTVCLNLGGVANVTLVTAARILCETAADWERMGKRLVLGLEDDLFIVIHLMIAGRLRWRSPGKKPPGRMSSITRTSRAATAARRTTRSART
mgnify:CR=1 FL=1